MNMNQVSNFAQPLPDLRKRSAIVDFLRFHDRHCDHLEPFKFSNCVKLHSLNIPYRLRDQAWDTYSVMAESGDTFVYDCLFSWFQEEQGSTVGFGGRAGGHIILIEDQANLSPDELLDLDMPELRRLARLVHAFDRLCDTCVSVFMELVTDYEIVIEKIYIN